MKYERENFAGEILWSVLSNVMNAATNIFLIFERGAIERIR